MSAVSGNHRPPRTRTPVLALMLAFALGGPAALADEPRAAHDDPTGLTSTCEEGFDAFQKTVYPKVRQDCVKCHNGQKPLAPPFAVADPMRSYEQLVSYMNFAKPEDSLLVIRAGNGHCGDEACDGDSGDDMLARARQWWEMGEKVCERNGHFFSAAKSLPNPLPEGDGFATMSFDLGDARPELKGINFQIEVQNYVDTHRTKGAYRFRSPRFTGGQRAIYVKDIKILLNGKYDVLYDQYTTVDRTAAFAPVNDPVKTTTAVLSGQTIILLKDGLEDPKISVSFVDISEQVATPVLCGSAIDFQKGVMPVLAKNKCATCHAPTGNSIGEKFFDCSMPVDRLCQASRSLIDPKFTMVSPLITFPSQGVAGHPQLSAPDRYEYVRAIKAWLGH